MVSEETGELHGVAKDGYVIDGYAYDDAGTEPVGEDDVVEADDTIYIIWAVDEE